VILNIEDVLDAEGQANVGIAHARSGELLAVAGRNSWFN
jgi:hypothetical protein